MTNEITKCCEKCNGYDNGSLVILCNNARCGCHTKDCHSHLTELLQQVNHDHEILVNTILDTHKAQLKDLYDELEGEKNNKEYGYENEWERVGYNSALNLAQERIKELIK